MSHLHHKVSALIDGELTGAARRRALAHARACHLCQRELEQTYALKQRLLGLAAAEPPADLFAALGSVRATPSDHGVGATRGSAVRKTLVGAGSMSLAVVTLAYAVGGVEAPEPTVTPPVKEFSLEFAGSTGLEPLSDPAVEVLSSSADSVRTTSVAASSLWPVAVTPRTVGASGDDARAVRWLRRAALAPSEVAYSARRDVTWHTSTGESTATLDVEHAPEQGTSYAATNRAASGTATFLAQSDAASSGTPSGTAVDQLISSYDLSLDGSDTVDGRPATVITASRDGGSVARFWIDDATGLLLRREMYDDGNLIRVSQLSDLQTSDAGFMKHLPPELEAPVGTRLSIDFAPALTDHGWACPPDLPSDFELTLLHRLEGAHDVMHAVYSDGLSTVSVFEERGILDASTLTGYRQVTANSSSVWVQQGLPTVVVWQADATVYTMVTDAPPSTTAELVAALPHEADQHAQSADNRVGRGLVRIGSALLPGG